MSDVHLTKYEVPGSECNYSDTWCGGTGHEVPGPALATCRKCLKEAARFAISCLERLVLLQADDN